MDNFYEALGTKIKGIRENLNLSQDELSQKMGVSRVAISQIETGEGRNLTLDTLIRIAASLGHKVRISFPKNIGNGTQLEVV